MDATTRLYTYYYTLYYTSYCICIYIHKKTIIYLLFLFFNLPTKIIEYSTMQLFIKKKRVVVSSSNSYILRRNKNGSCTKKKIETQKKNHKQHSMMMIIVISRYSYYILSLYNYSYTIIVYMYYNLPMMYISKCIYSIVKNKSDFVFLSVIVCVVCVVGGVLLLCVLYIILFMDS